MPQTRGNSTEFNELQTSAPESGSESSYMVISHELGIEVETLAYESNPDPPVLPECEHRFILNICSLSKPDTFVIAFNSPQPPSSHKPNFKSYEKEEVVEPCAPTEDAGQEDTILSGEVEIKYKEQFVSKISQTIPSLEKIYNDSKISDYVHQKIAEAMSLLKIYLNRKSITNSIQKPSKGLLTISGQDQGDEMINVEVDHIDKEPLNSSPQNIEAFQERETIKNDTMGQDMPDIIPDPEPKVPSSANFQGIFLSSIEDFGDILNYHSNITQQSWKRGLDNINSIYKNQWENLPTNDADTFLPISIKVISNQELKMLD
ncbi:hypothetical protein O181_011352 [Austropuccinia psidii MF-1]|uniref:Uncharacterized protein n=1 Tax=Austropuccinia psidii MF-1 TaxID=1389203 RepID=A0A9Q3BUC0_9BASI|nr:hypothetical protein [Austropuccinia psidii MF-1]